jgi:hypothetical protein
MPSRTITNYDQEIMVSSLGESTLDADQAYLKGAVKLGNFADTEAIDEGYLTIRGDDLVFIITRKAGVLIDPATAYVVAVAGVAVVPS